MTAAGGSDPAWLADAIRLVVEESVLYVKTAAWTLGRPARFAEAWLRRDRFMNPLGFVASTVTVLAVALQVAGYVSSVDAPASGLLRDLLRLPLPYLFFAAVGAIAHACAGRAIHRVGSSVAMSL